MKVHHWVIGSVWFLVVLIVIMDPGRPGPVEWSPRPHLGLVRADSLAPLRRTRVGYQTVLVNTEFFHRKQWRKYPCNVLLELPASHDVESFYPGDRLQFVGRLRSFGNSNAATGWMRVLSKRGICGTLKPVRGAPVFRVEVGSEPWHAMLRATYRRWLEKNHASPLLGAIVLGDAGALDAGQRDSWRWSGVSHLLAISGLHVGLIALFVVRLTRFLVSFLFCRSGALDSGVPGSLLGILAAWSYVWVAGCPVSATRAAWMVTCFLGARLVHRRAHGLTSLSIAALGILALDVRAVFEPSFQLSFGAVAALLLGARSMDRVCVWIQRQCSTLILSKIAVGVVRSTGTSVLCTLGTLPFVYWYFPMVPLVGLIANVIAIPLAAALLVLPGLLSLLFVGLGAKEWAQSLLPMIDLGEQLLDFFARFFARAPAFSSTDARWPVAVGLGVICFMVLAVFHVKHRAVSNESTHFETVGW